MVVTLEDRRLHQCMLKWLDSHTGYIKTEKKRSKRVGFPHPVEEKTISNWLSRRRRRVGHLMMTMISEAEN